MNPRFRTDAQVDLPALAHRDGCACLLHARRRLGGTLLGSGLLAGTPAWAQADPECRRSKLAGLAPAEQVERSASQQYAQLLQEASAKQALAPPSHEQVKRLRYIANRIIPFAPACNGRARDWKWQVNLIGSQELNAFCMPGGKICFYQGILAKLKLDDDEVAVIMGHEVAHALLEHARERMSKNVGTRLGGELLSQLLGLGNLGRTVVAYTEKGLLLKFSREDESEADALGLLLSSRAGYRPQAGVSLWQKMMAANKNAPHEWMSTHPSGDTRIKDMQARMARVDPMYQKAPKPDQRFSPPQA